MENVKEEIEKRVESIIEPLIREKGYFLLRVCWTGTNKKGKLEVYVDRIKGGITVEETKELAQDILGLLKIDNFPYDYTLDVSSPGLDRVLMTKKEYIWAKGKKIKIVDKQGNVETGILVEFDDDTLTLEKENKLYSYSIGNLVRVQLREMD